MRRGWQKNFEVFSAEEFIAAINQHIPEKELPIGPLVWLVFKLRAGKPTEMWAAYRSAIQRRLMKP